MRRLRAGISVSVLVLGWSATVAAATIFRSGDELVVQVERLDMLRQIHNRLHAEIAVRGPGGNKTFSLDLTDPVVPAATVIDIAGFGSIDSATVTVNSEAGDVVRSTNIAPVPVIDVECRLPLRTDVFAAIEPGTEMRRANDDPAVWRRHGAPRIALPDIGKLRELRLGVAQRSVASRAIEFPVVTDTDLPVPASENYVIVSRQSFAPRDASQRSLYFSYRKALYDQVNPRQVTWRKFLVEVPLRPEWLASEGDQTITLPLDSFAVHATDELAPRGTNMLGESPGGLAQGGQSADTDDQGRIYFTNISDGAGLVRFNPHTAKFEQPPVAFDAECRKLIPPDGKWVRSFDSSFAEVLCAHGRVFILYARNYRVHTPNGDFETCSGVVSLPQDGWDDAEAFRADIRLHAACWADAAFPLYDAPVPANNYTRKLVGPTATDHGLAFGNWRLDLDGRGFTQRLIAVDKIADGPPVPPTKPLLMNGLAKQRAINVGAAGRAFVRNQYGEITISRAALALSLPSAAADQLVDANGRFRTTFPGAPAGSLTVRFDIAAKIKADPERFGALAAALNGRSPGPGYCLTPIPGEPDQVVGVCEYGYFLSQLDFSQRRTTGAVAKRYLPLLSNGETTSLPVQCLLGPYNSAWHKHDDSLWLYFTGYTGISRVRWATGGVRREAVAAEPIHARMQSRPIDGTSRNHVKDYLHLLPALDGRLINIGRGRPGRGGGAFSAGLELFDPAAPAASETSVFMNRCYNLYTPAGRLVLSAAGAPPKQELFAASGAIKPEYVEDLAATGHAPQNRNPKVFAYDCTSGGGLRDLYGFELPTLGDGTAEPCHLAMSPCRRFLVLLQTDGCVFSYEIAGRRLIDGARLLTATGEPLRPLEFSRPSAWLWSTPDDRSFFHADASTPQSPGVSFFEVTVAPTGVLDVRPHLTVTGDPGFAATEFTNVVRCFLPDLTNADGSYDFVLGGDPVQGRPTVRVVEDFIPPRAGMPKESN